MKRFYLFCNAGMSTSLLASRMQKVADAHSLPIEIKAFSDSNMDTVVHEYNPEVILLGPQVKHLYEKVNERYGAEHIVEVIDSVDYGNVDGERQGDTAVAAHHVHHDVGASRQGKRLCHPIEHAAHGDAKREIVAFYYFLHIL